MARLTLRAPLILTALAANAAIAGCGGSGTASPSASAAAGGNGGSASALDQLTALSEKWKTTSAKVTYQLTGSDASSNGTLTVYWMPPSSSRFDFSGFGGDSSSNGTLITSPAGNYYCGQGTCISSGASAGSSGAADFFGAFSPSQLSTTLASLHGATLTTSHQTIAGQDSTCYATTSPNADFGKVCFTSDGLLTYAAGSSSSSSTGSAVVMQATSVSTSVSASDVQPPYPVTTYPTP